MPSFQLRPFDRDRDFPMIAKWREAHGRTSLPAAILPRLGVVVHDASDDCAALWLYMDNSVGVCFPEHAVTRPGLSVKEARAALLAALGFLKAEAARMDYGLMIIHTPPAFARILSRAGLFDEMQRGNVTMLGTTKDTQNGI